MSISSSEWVWSWAESSETHIWKAKLDAVGNRFSSGMLIYCVCVSVCTCVQRGTWKLYKTPPIMVLRTHSVLSSKVKVVEWCHALPTGIGHGCERLLQAVVVRGLHSTHPRHIKLHMQHVCAHACVCVCVAYQFPILQWPEGAHELFEFTCPYGVSAEHLHNINQNSCTVITNMTKIFFLQHLYRTKQHSPFPS